MVQSMKKLTGSYVEQHNIFTASVLCNWNQPSKRTHWEIQTRRSTQFAFDWGWGAGGRGGADPLIKPSFNLKKG